MEMLLQLDTSSNWCCVVAGCVRWTKWNGLQIEKNWRREQSKYFFRTLIQNTNNFATKPCTSAALTKNAEEEMHKGQFGVRFCPGASKGWSVSFEATNIEHIGGGSSVVSLISRNATQLGMVTSWSSFPRYLFFNNCQLSPPSEVRRNAGLHFTRFASVEFRIVSRFSTSDNPILRNCWRVTFQDTVGAAVRSGRKCKTKWEKIFSASLRWRWISIGPCSKCRKT